MADTDTETRIIEIEGVKIEVDLRHAKRVDTLRVGDKIRILDTSSSYGGPKVYNGVIVGFEPFEALPTIVIAYLEHDFSKAELKFLHYNAKSEKFEIVKAIDDDIDLSKKQIIEFFDRQRAKLNRELEELSQRERYFLDHFGVYWEQIVPEHEPEVSG